MEAKLKLPLWEHIGYHKIMIQVRELLLEDHSSPYANWFDSLPPVVAAKITTAKLRIEQGNFSNIKWFSGIGEYVLDFGPGWRIYLAKEGDQIVILLGGGSKKGQKKDINRALKLWENYKQQRKLKKR